MVSRDNKKLLAILIALTTLTILAVFTTGQPTGVDNINVNTTSRYAEQTPADTLAQAGNVTELIITARSVTQAWQGYYGNISGTITLENANGDQFYNWASNEPEGEIFASVNSSITWSNVTCFDHNGDVNFADEEAFYDIGANDDDGINETFTSTTHPVFYVGTTNMTSCPTAYPFQSNTSQAVNFPNALLESEADQALIFVAILENRDALNDTDKLGFDGTPTDFQLFVAEDGHTQAAQGTTTYYFWAEIE